MLKENKKPLQNQRDKATTEAERTRIAKIVAKQKSIASRLASMADIIYKDNLMASNDARDDVKRDASLNFDQVIDDIDRENSGKEIRNGSNSNQEPDPLNPETITKPEVNSSPSQPVVLF